MKKQIFVQFTNVTKNDDGTVRVRGRLVSQVVDKANERFLYQDSKPYFQAWSDELSKATGGKNLGNIREMHDPKKAAGRVVQIDFNDAEKAIDIEAEIDDLSTARKCERGTLTGFSIGGDYVKRTAATDIEGVYDYVARPVESSVVDNPCVPGSNFTYVGKSGVAELRKLLGREPNVRQTWACEKGEGHQHAYKQDALQCDGEDAPDQKIAKCMSCVAEVARLTDSVQGMAEITGNPTLRSATLQLYEAMKDLVSEYKTYFDEESMPTDKAASTTTTTQPEASMQKTEEQKPQTPAAPPAEPEKPVEKAAAPQQLEKAMADAISAAVTAAVAPLAKSVETQGALIKTLTDILANVPQPGKGAVRVTKSGDEDKPVDEKPVEKTAAPRSDLEAFRNPERIL
jgi:hypothetical protein